MSDLSAARHWAHVGRPGSSDPHDAVSWFGAIQAQDYLASLWAIGLRCTAASEADVEHAIAQGRVVRTWPMRGTIHWVASEDVRWMLRLLGPRAVARAAPRRKQMGTDDDLLARSSAAFVAALSGGRRLAREELYDVLRRAGIPTDGQRGYHILWHCAHAGTICFGPRDGKRTTFVLLDEWVPPTDVPDRDEALARLAARYFGSHGPATAADLAGWSGLTVADARRGAELARHVLDSVTIGGRTYWSGVPRPAAEPRRRACLLAAFDEFLVGYKDRDAVLDPAFTARINVGGGILSPVLVVDGRVGGTWRRHLRRNIVEVAVTLFGALAADVAAEVEAAAEEYGRFVGRSVALTYIRP